MNTCWFCCHPGVRRISREDALNIDLSKVCEGHMDYQVFYYEAPDAWPVSLTPRAVLSVYPNYRF